MMSSRNRGRLAALLSLFLVTVLAGRAAHAYWRAAGSGTGAGATGTTVALVLSPGQPGANLYPGGTSTVVLTASNPGTAIVRITSLVLDTSQGTGGLTVDPSHAGCAPSALGFTTQTNGGAGWSVPARTGAVDATLAISLVDAIWLNVDAADACQGVQATVYLKSAS